MTKREVPTVIYNANKKYCILSLDTEDDSCGEPYQYNLFGEYKSTRDKIYHIDISTSRKRPIIDILNAGMKDTYLIGYNLGYDLNNLYPEYQREQHVKGGKFHGFVAKPTKIRGMDVSGKWFQGIKEKDLCPQFGYMNYIDQHKKTDTDIVNACRSHAEGVYVVMATLEQHLNELGYTMFYTNRYQPTASGMAFAIWKDMMHQDPYNYWDKRRNAAAKGSYHGGWVEVFIRRKVVAYYYDVCSMYPSVMRSEEYPNPNVHIKETLSSADCSNIEDYCKQYAGFAHGYITVPDDLQVSPFPHVEQPSKKLIFPTGTWSANLTFPEILYLLELGGSFEAISITYTDKWRPYIEFVDKFYPLKIEKGGRYKQVAKLLLNGLSGKTGQYNAAEGVWEMAESLDAVPTGIDDLRTTFVLNDSNYYWYKTAIKPDPTKRVDPNLDYPYYPLLSSYITAYSRIKLHKMMATIGYENVVYCDTDSLVSKVKLPAKDITSTQELGLWKYETGNSLPVLFEALAPKKYRFLSGGKWTYKANGIPKSMQEDFWKDPYKDLTFQHPLSIREVLRHPKLDIPMDKRRINYWVTIHKRYTDNPKREFDKMGNSKPLHIKEKFRKPT
jgi:hypothetical protein